MVRPHGYDPRCPDAGCAGTGRAEAEADIDDDTALEPSLEAEASDTDIFGQEIVEADAFDHLVGTDLLGEDES